MLPRNHIGQLHGPGLTTIKFCQLRNIRYIIKDLYLWVWWRYWHRTGWSKTHPLWLRAPGPEPVFDVIHVSDLFLKTGPELFFKVRSCEKGFGTLPFNDHFGRFRPTGEHGLGPFIKMQLTEAGRSFKQPIFDWIHKPVFLFNFCLTFFRWSARFSIKPYFNPKKWSAWTAIIKQT